MFCPYVYLRMLILGITGGIATGKSTVTRLLADLGAPTLSADALAHDLLAPGTPTARTVLAAFPEAIAPGQSDTIDRRVLGRLVFADPQARARLEALTHPPIIAALQAQAQVWRGQPTPRAAALEIPLLFEVHLEWLVDRIVVVTCSQSDQVSRLLTRTGLGEAEVHRLMASQLPLTEKIARADYLIETDDFDNGMENTRRQVAALWDSLESDCQPSV